VFLCVCVRSCRVNMAVRDFCVCMCAHVCVYVWCRANMAVGCSMAVGCFMCARVCVCVYAFDSVYTWLRYFFYFLLCVHVLCMAARYSLCVRECFFCVSTFGAVYMWL